MRGINISSIIFLIIVLCNLTALFIITYFKSISKGNRSSGAAIFITVCMDLILLICLVFFSINIGVTHYNIYSERLPPEFDGFEILQISDFHTGSFHGGTSRLIKKIKTENPDIIVLTGDLIDETAKDISTVTELVSQLVLIAPTYSVTGNHDIWYSDLDAMENMMRDKGVVLLENRKIALKRGSSGINLSGISDPDINKRMSSKAYVSSSLNELPPGKSYNILLFHRANMFDILKGSGYQLVLSGHMHGGQLQIPFVGGIISPQLDRKWLPRYTDGKWEDLGTTIIVSRGLGNNVPVPRILNPPEVVVVTLKSN